MLKNYLLISFRNLRKQFSYSLINIAGLGLGLATALLLILWVSHELSYDSFHSKADRIYRSSMEYSFGGQVSKTSVSPTALLPALKSFAEVEEGVRVYNPSGWSPFIVKKDENIFQESKFFFADSTFFQVFDFELISGNKQKALTEPYAVILTENTAKKYFGNEDPVGKTLTVNNSREYSVTGVLKNIPSNSILHFDFLGSFNSLAVSREKPFWWSANYQTFFVLHKNASLTELDRKLNDLVKKELAAEITNEGDYVRYNSMKLTDIYLRSDYSTEEASLGDIKYVYIFSVIAVLVLVIASINYVNLATARAADRAKEVGLRKVVGAMRQQLFAQFMGESIVITVLSFLVAFLLAQLMLPVFNQLTGKEFTFSSLLSPTFLSISLGMLVLIALLSGAYPAMVITGFKPATVLKGNFRFSGRGIWLRKALVITQFSISVILIVGTLIIQKQLTFIQSTKLGYNKDNNIVLPYDRNKPEVFASFKTELMRSGVVQEVGRGNESPVQIRGGYTINTAESSERGIIITGLPVDEGYIPSLGIELLQGRNFTEADVKRVSTDTVYTFILNESALAALFLDQETAIGTPVELGQRKGEIIGVVKDFNFSSLHNAIGPLVIFPEEFQLNHVFIKLNTGDTKQALEKIESISKTIYPHRPFEFQFVDQQYSALYQAEERMGSIFTVFATLAIIIACMGLFGLVSFSAAQRTKEISIRKVLGATAQNIVMLITRDYTPLILLAIVIGLPVSWLMMTKWLNSFAYKTEIGLSPLLWASLGCVVIAFGTASYQAIKAAITNPANNLRNE
jgi:putative ABC transport system permease protein